MSDQPRSVSKHLIVFASAMFITAFAVRFAVNVLRANAVLLGWLALAGVVLWLGWWLHRVRRSRW